MAVSERQRNILNNVIEEYIKSAQPVSSQLLEKKHNFKISSATIRNEMQSLTKNGYLFQPHTSAGRVPTDKGYRLFVDWLFEKESFEEDFFDSKMGDWLGGFGDTFKFASNLAKNLADLSSNLVLCYLSDEKIILKEGWEGILRQPEFKENHFASHFAKLIKNFEKEVGEMQLNSDIKVYIGSENPLPKTGEFSTIISRCHFPRSEEGMLAILGPKRMDYDTNIGLINSLIKSLEELK